MAVSEPASRQVSFKLVERGWDPAEVLDFIEELESRLRRLWHAELASGIEEEGPEVLLATAEHRADEVNSRAAKEAVRMRVRAADDARATRVEAKRDALDLVASGRVLAAEIVQRARDQEEALYGRLMELRSVVKQTEQLLESVAGGTGAREHQVAQATGSDDFRVTINDGARLEPGRGRDPGVAKPMPAEVRRLLERLQACRDDRS